MSGFFKDIPPLFDHQKLTIAKLLNDDRVYDMSDPGTGKTRSCLEAISTRRAAGQGKALVLAPKAILWPAWSSDCAHYTPHLTLSIATAANREKAFRADADIYVTNHDAAKWLADKENKWALEGIDQIYIDEITAFKHRTSQRSKALRKIVSKIPIRVGLSGTPMSNTILDLWHQIVLLDDGEHLGNQFFAFRNTVCSPQQVGPRKDMLSWTDKPGAREAVADILVDMTIRHKLEECIDIPENNVTIIPFQLSPKHMALYNELAHTAAMSLETGDITAIHAASLTTKLLQTASGAVYDTDKTVHKVASERYELIIELAMQREQCLIAFNWTHQRDELVALAEKLKIPYAVIDGSINDRKRNEAVMAFQEGTIKIIFAQPQSTSHGLTLTRGTTTIWASPTYDAERFEQFNRRIYRAGQTKKTETLLIAAVGTLDEYVFDKMSNKQANQHDLLWLLKTALPQPKKETL